MSTPNGGSEGRKTPLELSDVLNIEMRDGAAVTFEVVGILEDPENGRSYAVLHHEGADDDEDEFIVTDLQGNLLDEDALAQEILDDFLAFADDEEGRGAHNGETG
jgi:uncharacterized protein YrzB (UPF0473 family)